MSCVGGGKAMGVSGGSSGGGKQGKVIEMTGGGKAMAVYDVMKEQICIILLVNL